MKKIVALALALCMVFALAACGGSSSAPAATSGGPFAPDGPVTLVVAYKAGSGTDNTARILAKYAEKYVGQTIVIENVEGASGSQGWNQLAKADPDGMTIGFINLPNFNSNIVQGKGSYKVEDFKAICNHVTETSIVVVRADDDRFPDLKTLVEYAKANKLVAATNGAKASNHIGAQAFAKSAGFSYTAVPADGTANQLLSLRGKESDFCVVKLADIAGTESEYRILGVFNTERLPELPDVPTLGELGYYKDWLGSSRCVVAPAGVSDEVVAFYEAAFKSAMEDPEYLAAAEQAGMATDYKNAADTAALIAQQQSFAESLTDEFWS
ncbi:MAG: tripartite tricarboxylate transporter substrate binding protein [Oscillospiraceae bacterium]|nr:tripartite tricarboxylate transporter substrate binding protein [Oscillospiraceae bacterium]